MNGEGGAWKDQDRGHVRYWQPAADFAEEGVEGMAVTAFGVGCQLPVSEERRDRGALRERGGRVAPAPCLAPRSETGREPPWPSHPPGGADAKLTMVVPSRLRRSSVSARNRTGFS